MRHLDLFSGIGGFALAARWMGWKTIQFVEIDKFCQKVLNKNFPHVPIHGDIKTFDGSKYRGAVDILTGGFPCQPFSVAGKRKGKEDYRHLWPEMFRVIDEVKPTWIVGENVTGIIGLVLDDVLTALENKGYDTETYIIPACALNAPHRRDRVWIIANCNGKSWNVEQSKERYTTIDPIGDGSEQFSPHTESNGCERQNWSHTRTKRGILPEWIKAGSKPLRCGEVTTDTNSDERRERRMHTNGHETTERHFSSCDTWDDWRNWKDFPSQSPVCRRNDGIPNRVDRIKSLGNAIVPQVAFEIFKAIELSFLPRDI